MNHSPLKSAPLWLGVMLVVGLVVLYGSWQNKPTILSLLDSQITHAQFAWRGSQQASKKIVIVDIDEFSLRQYGQWPWSRKLVAGLVERLQQANAAVIGFDIVFAEDDRHSLSRQLPEIRRQMQGYVDPGIFDEIEFEDFDLVLGEVVARAPAVLGYVFQMRDDGLKNPAKVPFPSANINLEWVSENASGLPDYGQLLVPQAYRALLNVDTVAQSETEGFLNVFPDQTGLVRRVPLVMVMDNVAYPSLATEMVRLGLSEQKISLKVAGQMADGRHALLGVSIGERFLPTDIHGQAFINFRGPVYSYRYISAAKVVGDNFTEDLSGKYVLIGSSATGLHDLLASPFSSIHPGVELQATLIDNILHRDLLKYDIYTESGFTIVAVLVSGLMLCFVLVYTRPLTGGLFAVLLVLGLVVGHYRYFFLDHQLVGLSYPLAALVLTLILVTLINYVMEGRERQFIQAAFGRYVSPKVVQQLVESHEKLSLQGEQREVTVFFSDIRNFTSISERMDSAELGRLLNMYLTEMSDIIMESGGMVDKYIGDAVMAVWGAPLDDKKQASRAVMAALRMQRRLEVLQKQWLDQGWPLIDIGMGINTGVVNVGNFGSDRRFDYTVIGDHVNLASRLEGLNKLYGTHLIISEFTRKALADDVVCRELDWVKVKGKNKPVKIFEALPHSDSSSGVIHEISRFDEALTLYRQREFQASQAIISELKDMHSCKLYQLYNERIEQYIAEPPPENWDGAFVFRRK